MRVSPLDTTWMRGGRGVSVGASVDVIVGVCDGITVSVGTAVPVAVGVKVGSTCATVAVGTNCANDTGP